MRALTKTLLIIFVALLCITNANAISIDKNNIVIDSGDSSTVDVYADIDSSITNIDFNLTYSSYDIVADFIVNSSFIDANAGGIKHSITLGEHESGKIKIGTIKISVIDNPTVTSGTVSITSAIAKNSNSESKILNTQIINVNVNNNAVEVLETEEIVETDKSDVDYNLLKSIESDIVNIKLKKDVFDYEVTVADDIEKLDLIPVAISDIYKIDISSQKISELKDNKIVIKVFNDEIEKEYNIKVKVETDDDIKQVVDEEKKVVTFKYKGKWVAIILLLVAFLFSGIYLNTKK